MLSDEGFICGLTLQAEALEREAKRRRVDNAELASLHVRIQPMLLMPV